MLQLSETGERRVLAYLLNKTSAFPPLSLNTSSPTNLINPVAHSITNLEAYQFLGTTSLATYIMRLKRKGYPITSEWITVQNRYEQPCHVKRYTLDPTQLPNTTAN